MQLHDIFAKPIDRTIEGVIKADDMASLKLEVEEYVITNEVTKSLELFLDAYNDYNGANGVWISGFFGSGKSHLLKMLALLLENQQIGDQRVLDYFLQKIDSAMLKGDLQRAIKIPSRSILFNIDQKADTISKTEIDAVLVVFLKVFNEMRGYYGKQGYVAQFERDLDKRGDYEAFKEAYAEIAGKNWEQGREEVILEKGNVARAYARVSGSLADEHRNIIDAYRNDYKLSIEEFAEEVNDYIQTQEPGFRLNFFVDEVGQYIADNIKLMTNLQTIAESLATKCKGQSWVIVTAQEEMDTVLGDMGKQRTTDFSKIQDRFKNRLKLTSQNVDEVIKKRLLKKNTVGETFAEDLYQREKNNFGTLFDFTDGATKYRGFKDEQDFIDSYPFIPYQFGLFQTAIETLSGHNAFEGKHSSVGERSMLGVFQEVTVKIAENEVGQLAPFDLMFEGLRNALKSQIQRSVLNAENLLKNEFAKRVLKALFLVKYVKGFNATPRNLRVLVQDRFDQDIASLRKKVEEALELLEQQTYIQRNGEAYEYLTDEEKDVEQEIKNTDVDSADIAKSLEDILFIDIIKDRKIRYDVTGQDYPYTKKLDDRILGREQELTIHFITPFNEHIGDFTTLTSHSFGRTELMIVLPASVRFMQDLQHYKKTEKYIRVHSSSAQQDSTRMLLHNKGYQNTERMKQIRAHLRELVGKARIFVAGEEIQISGEDPKTRIVKGFYELVKRTYPNLRMLKEVSYTENDIRRYLSSAQSSLFKGDTARLNEAEQEVLGYIQGNQRMGTRTTMKNLETHFSQKPYGWHLAAHQCLVAMLVGRGKIEVRADSNILEDAELERALRNNRVFGNLIIDPQITFSSSELRRLKDFYDHFFDKPPKANDAKALGKETKEIFQDVLGELRELRAQSGQYAFLSALDAPIARLSELIGKDYTYYLKNLPQEEDDLLDMKEDLLDPIRRFMSGANKGIYDDAREFLRKQEANFSTYGDGKVAELRDILDAPESFKGNQMQTAKRLMDALKKEIEEQVRAEKQEALEKVDNLQTQMHATQDYGELTEAQKAEIDDSFYTVRTQLERQNNISVIRDQVGRYKIDGYNRLLTKIAEWNQNDDQEAIEYISLQELKIAFEKAYLADEADVEDYLKALKEAMLRAIRSNKRIRY